MFAICPANILKNKDLSALDVRVYITIQSFTDKNGYCFPSVAKIADICGCSKRTVFRIINKLAALNIIQREHRIRDDGGFSSNMYLVTQMSLPSDTDVTTPSDTGITTPSDTDVTANKNPLNKNINLKFIHGARESAREKSHKFDKDAVSLTLEDINDTLSMFESVANSRQYECVKLKGGVLAIRPLSVLGKNEVLESQILQFFDKFNRDVEVLDFNTHYSNEVKIEV